MTTQLINAASVVATNPRAGLHTPGLTATVVHDHVQPQVHRIELAPVPSSNLEYDRSTMEKNLKEAIQFLNKQLSSKEQGLGFSYDESTKSPVITVRNLDTGEVLKQFPSADLVRLAHKLDELKGILYNAKA